MAKYANDVNKNIKIIDVQKQFPGGLKTVDTDDALGQVYLREAENVSLSEFSFLEKRYGLSEQEVLDAGIPNVDRIQGYFEFVTDEGRVDKILFADGKAYIKQGAGDFVLQQYFHTENGFIYPEGDLNGLTAGQIDFLSGEITIQAVATNIATAEDSSTANAIINAIGIVLSEGEYNYNSGTVTVNVNASVSALGNASGADEVFEESPSNIKLTGVATITHDNLIGITLDIDSPSNIRLGADVIITAEGSTEQPAETWEYIGTTSPTYDYNFNLNTDGGYMTSTCPTSPGFVQSFLPSASNYLAGDIIRVSTYENSQGFPQACPGFFFYEAIVSQPEEGGGGGGGTGETTDPGQDTGLAGT